MSADTGWYVAGALGFALGCVLVVVWLLSKRTVNVHQENHAAPVVVNAGGDGGSLGVAPTLIGWAVKALLIGFALVFLANAIGSIGSGISTGLQSIGDGLSQQPAQQPAPIVLVTPTAQPVATAHPVVTISPVVIEKSPEIDHFPQAQPIIQPVETPDIMPVIVGVLAVVAVGVWGYAGVTLWRGRSIKRPNVVTPAKAAQARERRMEDILPESVHEVAR